MGQSASQESARLLNAPMPNGPLTLNDAVLLAVSRHPTITSQIATVAQARGGIDVAKAGYFPQITVGTGSGNSSQTGTANSLSLQIAQMLYDFGKVSSTVDQAEATVRREQANLLQQLSSVEQKAAESFINVHRYQEQVRIAAQEVDATKQIYQMAKLRSQSGVSTRADPVQAETRLQSAQATLIAVKALNDETRQHLRTLVGGPVDKEVALPLVDDRITAIRLDKASDTSLMPGVLVAQAQELINRSQLDNAKAQMWPTFSLNYADTKNITGKNAATYADRGSNHTFTVGIQWTAYQGGALAGQIRAAQYAYDAARSNVTSARLNGSDAARGYREQALGARSRLGTLRQRTLSIGATRDLYREQYKLGSRSILDLLNAEQEYYQAALDEETSKHDYWIALIDYIGALGTGNTFYGVASRSIQGVKVQ
jgi:adhesin transport system outer membrane protein